MRPEPGHLAQLLLQAAERHPNKKALFRKENGAWQGETWKEAWRRTLQTAHFLENLGVRAGDRVALWSPNRPEWLYVDMAAMCLGAVTVPIYATLAHAEIQYILNNSGAKVLAVANAADLSRLEPAAAGLKTLEHVITFEGEPYAGSPFAAKTVRLDKAAPVDASFEKRAVEEIGGDHRGELVTIIYTSGTTGEPKGVMLTHGNLLANLAGVVKAIPLSASDVHLSFLPLCHVFERLCGYYLTVWHGAQIAYAESMDAVPQNILEIRPTLLMAVPRFYEKVYGKIAAKVHEAAGVRKTLFEWAVARGRARSEAMLAGKPVPPGLKAAFGLAEAVVFKKIRRQLGGRIRFCVSGSAPLPEPIARFFHSVGILIIEGYGLTETSPVITCNRLDKFRFGTVGLRIDCAELKIAPDGEILTRGPSVMKGYFGAEDATRAVIIDGWFHTGDLGSIDADGFLKITGRKKEIIVTSGGKKVSTQIVEALFEKEPGILRCVLYGEGKNFLTALIVPDFEFFKKEAVEKTGRAATPGEIVKADWVWERIKASLDRAHKALAPFEQIKQFRLLDRDFSIDHGELTPTMKPRRSIILQKHRHLLDPFYETTSRI